MKIVKLFGLILINLAVSISSKIICSVDKFTSSTILIKDNNKVKNNLNNKRKMSIEEDFKPIRIYFSLEDIRQIIHSLSSISSFNLNEALLNRIFLYLNNTKTYIEKLVKVRRIKEKITISLEELKEKLGLTLSGNDMLLNNGVEADLIIVPLYTIDTLVNSISINIFKRDEETNRTIVSILNIPSAYLNNPRVSQFEVETILLHEITHILGFQYESFYYFPGGINNVIREITDSNGKKRYYIITPKVVQKAKEYYGCDSLIGLELENQDNNPSSHWEARILLGEYMNLEQYTPELVISDFTLALLEDSGWYQVNYYTGGLMRFGKNKGCDFLNYECPNTNMESLFKNEFFGYNDINNPSCTSGRLSRAYCLGQSYSKTDFTGFGGLYEKADYCYTFYFRQEEENIQQYIGNCKMGKGDYGSMIEYNYVKIKNGDLEDILGEEYSDKSFCVLSEIYDKNNSITKNFEGIIHPICYEMFCSDTTLTIKIKEQYIACPRQGGKVRLYNNSNFSLQGYIYCPDYNLICTGSVLCNDIFDCIKKESISLRPNYTYPVSGETSSQKISEIKNLILLEGYEMSLINNI